MASKPPLYLVTGANGFVGRVLCRRLGAQGARVRALLRQPMAGPWHEYVLGELGNGALPTSACADVSGIFHAAGVAHAHALNELAAAVYQRVNVKGTEELLRAAQVAGVRGLVYFSSVKAVGAPGDHCVDESFDADPENPYGQSKREAEALVIEAAATSDLHACVLRPTLVYGVGVKGNLSLMIRGIAAGRLPPLPDFGDRRSMVSVEDLGAAALRAMECRNAQGRIYIVADGMGYSTRGLYVAISEALGRQAPGWALPLSAIRIGAKTGDILERLLMRRMPLSSAVFSLLSDSACYRADRIRAELGWVPRETFYDLTQQMVRFRGSLDASSS